MAMTMAQASAAMREAMRETVKRYSTWYLLEGIFLVIAGVIALVYPYLASVTLIFLIGWLLIISGVFRGISLIGAKDVPHFWWELVSVVLAIVIGVLLLRHPDAGLLIMTVLLIVYFIIEGISKVVFALNIRPFPGWGWLLASGVIGILLGACFLALDFKQVEDGIAYGAPREEAWLAAFGLTMTLVWIYMEFLRLISILNSSD